MIGLLDYDAIASQEIKYPNLELMKMATYLRRKRQSVHIITDLNDLEIYNEIYLFQNDSKHDIPAFLFAKSNVKWFGLVFTNGKYTPLPKEIEICAPTIGIYKSLFKEFLIRDLITMEKVSYLLNASYVRFSAPLNKRYLKSIKPRRRVIVYDPIAFTGDWEKKVRRIVAKDIAGFYFLHKQIIDDSDIWVGLFTNFKTTIFAYNYIQILFSPNKEKMERIIKTFQTYPQEQKRHLNFFSFAPIIEAPYYENTLLFITMIEMQLKAGLILPWRDPRFLGNPYHPFIRALSMWASSAKYYYSLPFADFLIKKDMYREHKFVRRLIRKNEKYKQIFFYNAEEIIALYGGLRTYETRRNQKSIFRDYL